MVYSWVQDFVGLGWVLEYETFRFQKGSKFGFSKFGPGFGLFVVKQVWSMGFLKGFK